APALQSGLALGRLVVQALGRDDGVRLVPDDGPDQVGLSREVVVELRLARARRGADVVERGRGDAGAPHEGGGSRDDELPGGGTAGRRPRDRLAQQTSLVSTAFVGSTGVV